MSCVPTAGNDLPGELNLIIYQGATFFVSLTWTDGNNTPIDLTGYTADMKVKSGSNLVIELSTVNERISIIGVDGIINLTITATDTTSLSASNGVYDLLLTSGTGVVYPLLTGLVSVRQGVTA